MAIVLFIVILLALVIVHEFGHFITAKAFKIRVDEFGIGLPPKAKTLWKRGDTEYTLNWLPLGGFVRIFGETPDEESIDGPDKERSFVHKSKWIQAAVLVGGVVFNMFFAWLLLATMFVVGTDLAIDRSQIDEVRDTSLVIHYVLEESPAFDVGLIPGDEIESMRSGVDTLEELYPQEAVDFIQSHADQSITIEVERNGQIEELTMIPEAGLDGEDSQRKVLGISMGLVGFVQTFNPIEALTKGAIFTYDMTVLSFNALMGFFADAFTLSADVNDIAGPIGIVSFVGDAASGGLVDVIFLTALISINLAILNILPIPALDGGRLLFLIIEALKGSPIPHEIANRVHAFFFVLLIVLILVVSYFDVARIIGN